MKNLVKNYKSLLALAFMTLTLGFTACSSSSNKIDDNIHVTMNMTGTYKGDVSILQPRKEANTEEETPNMGDIALVIEQDKAMKFQNFPITDLIKGLFEEEMANEILEELGEYPLDLVFEPKKEKDGNLYFEIETEEFVIPVKSIEPINIIADIDTMNEEGVYSTKESSGNIQFTIYVKTRTPNVSALPYEAIMEFNFDKITR